MGAQSPTRRLFACCRWEFRLARALSFTTARSRTRDIKKSYAVRYILIPTLQTVASVI